MKEQETQTVRIHKESVKSARIYVANNGGTIGGFVEAAIRYVIKKKLKMKENEFYEMQSK